MEELQLRSKRVGFSSFRGFRVFSVEDIKMKQVMQGACQRSEKVEVFASSNIWDTTVTSAYLVCLTTGVTIKHNNSKQRYRLLRIIFSLPS